MKCQGTKAEFLSPSASVSLPVSLSLSLSLSISLYLSLSISLYLSLQSVSCQSVSCHDEVEWILHACVDPSLLHEVNLARKSEMVMREFLPTPPPTPPPKKGFREPMYPTNKEFCE